MADAREPALEAPDATGVQMADHEARRLLARLEVRLERPLVEVGPAVADRRKVIPLGLRPDDLVEDDARVAPEGALRRPLSCRAELVRAVVGRLLGDVHPIGRTENREDVRVVVL